MNGGLSRCGLCSLEFPLSGVGRHITGVHLGGGGDVWECGECEFQGATLDEIGGHCLLRRHDARRIQRDSLRLQNAQIRILVEIQEFQEPEMPAQPTRFRREKSPSLEFRSYQSPPHSYPEKKHAQSPPELLASEEMSIYDDFYEHKSPVRQQDTRKSAELIRPVTKNLKPSPCLVKKQSKPKAKKATQLKVEGVMAPSPSSDQSPSSRSVECSLCQGTVTAWKPGSRMSIGLINTVKLRDHVSRFHMEAHLYGCSQCPKTGAVKDKMRGHCSNKSQHDHTAEVTIINPKLRRNVVDLLIQCFPIMNQKLSDMSSYNAYVQSF